MNALSLIEQQVQRMKNRPRLIATLDWSGVGPSNASDACALLDGAVQKLFKGATGKQEPGFPTVRRSEQMETAILPRDEVANRKGRT